MFLFVRFKSECNSGPDSNWAVLAAARLLTPVLNNLDYPAPIATLPRTSTFSFLFLSCFHLINVCLVQLLRCSPHLEVFRMVVLWKDTVLISTVTGKVFLTSAPVITKTSIIRSLSILSKDEPEGKNTKLRQDEMLYDHAFNVLRVCYQIH